jgi:chorismate mutase/prephenate dehydratase
MSLEDLRKEIDRVDSQIIALLNERADLVHEVGEYKKSNGLEIYAPEREGAMMRNLVNKSHGRLPEKAIRCIYREIISASLALEKGLTIAYFGQPASWTHQAARKNFGGSVQYVSRPTIEEVFDAVQRGHADYGVVPIENSIEGAVNHTLDVFVDSELLICAQVFLRIENNLLSNSPTEKIERVFSHPQALAQCRGWLRNHLPQADLIEVTSTSSAAERAGEEPGTAAVAGEMAAEVYNLPILARSIQDSATNTTRFLVIGTKTCTSTGEDRTSVMFSVQDKAGALYSALQPFKKFRISMSRIQSRPSTRKNWEYIFFVDLHGHCEDEAVIDALKELEEHCTFVKILGSYPSLEA